MIALITLLTSPSSWLSHPLLQPLQRCLTCRSTLLALARNVFGGSAPRLHDTWPRLSGLVTSSIAHFGQTCSTLLTLARQKMQRLIVLVVSGDPTPRTPA